MNNNHLPQHALTLVLVGLVATFLSVQPAQAVVSTWTSVTPSPDSGCDIALIVGGSLTADSSDIGHDQVFAEASKIGGSLIFTARTTGSSPLQLGQPSGDPLTSNGLSPLTLGKVSLALNLPVNAFTANRTDSAFAAIIGNAVSLSPNSYSSLVSPLSQLSLDDGSDLLSSNNGTTLEIIAVPEPATWAMIVGGFGLLLSVQRMRRVRAAR
jgi:hypothetical protein